MNDRLPGTTWDNPIWHGKWRIFVADADSRQNYEFVHDDYDGAPDANDWRHGFASSVEEAKSLIDGEYDLDIKAMQGCRAPPGVCKHKEFGCVPGERDPSHDDCKYEEKEHREMQNIDASDYAEELPTPPDSVDFGAPRVRFKWCTPDGDKLVAHIARVSNSSATIDDPAEKLIKYLIRNRHWSPFEMVNLCLEIHTERDISAQILRHSKEFRFQEFSTRYAEVEDLRWSTECRFQDHKNRQNSFDASGQIEYLKNRAAEHAKRGNDATVHQFEHQAKLAEETVSYFDAVVNETRERSLDAYRELLERGVAKECARRVLPIGLMPTVMYINSNLRGWIHYLAERTKPGVQKEHREIALAVEPFIAEHFPMVWDAVIADRADAAIKEWKVEQFDHIGAMFTEVCGMDWHERYPNTGLAEALRLNLCRFKHHPETEEKN